jgi:NAD(P)-dependent dehydrogenase (short-subunit alcohol dehydrogenase family)
VNRDQRTNVRRTAELFDLTGKVVIVTGSTKGIGRAMAEGLASAGASVVVSSRKQDLCDRAAAEIAATTGAEVFARACHVGEWSAVPQFVAAVHERFGRIDGLVNNAGINPARVKPEDMTLDYWRKVFTVNLEGPLRMSQCVFPHMKTQGNGSIVHIGTMAAYSGGGAVCAYGASKAGLLNLTKSQATEWAQHGIRVNILSPGPFMSEMMEGGERTAPGFFELVAGGTFQQRIAEPGEIVGPVCYLISDASSFVTGDDLSVSGGMFK